MYRINLYENGVFCTQIGGEIRLLTDALKQMKALSQGLHAKEVDKMIALTFERAGTPCALVLVDELGMPIQSVEYRKEV